MTYAATKAAVTLATSNGCTCDLELSFMSAEDTLTFFVVDAEGEEVATCRERRFADLVAAALNAFQAGKWLRERHSTICLVHENVRPEDGHPFLFAPHAKEDEP